MIENSIGYVLLLLGLGAISLQRLYSSVPARELKRLASRGDHLAAALFRAVAYGSSLRMLLWMVTVVSLSAGLLLTIPHVPVAAAFVLIVMVAFAGFVILPTLRLTQGSAQVAAWFVPALVFALRHTHGLLDKVARAANRFRELPLHSRLYEKEDLMQLLASQASQSDNRIQPEDLDLASRTLAFSDTTAADIVLPRKQTHLVDADDSIGPILLDGLHKQHQTSFLVYKDAPENIIGSLAMNDAVTAKQGGRVFDLIRSDLIYVHEDFTARQILHAFHKTNHQVAVVINNAEEFVGVITLDHLLGQLLGNESIDNNLAYGDRAAMAAYRPQPPESSDEKTEELAAVEVASSPEATEVVK